MPERELLCDIRDYLWPNQDEEWEPFAHKLCDRIDAILASPSEAEHAERLWQIRVELAALVADPKNPDWMPALTNGNPADAECLNKAYALSRSERHNGDPK